MTKRLAVVGIAVLLLAGCTKKVVVRSSSMEPTIKAGESVVIDPFQYLSNPINRFDIVMFKAPPVLQEGGKETFYVHRVIALSGEQVEIRQGKVFINGQPLQEPFTTNPSGDDFGPIAVPSNEFFLLGDNRPNSLDGRYYKPATIKKDDIVAKVTETGHR